jgi:tight adherence protein B
LDWWVAVLIAGASFLIFLLVYLFLLKREEAKKLHERFGRLKIELLETIEKEKESLFRESKDSMIKKKFDAYIKGTQDSKRPAFMTWIASNPHLPKLLLIAVPSFFASYFGVQSFLKQTFEVNFLLASLITGLLTVFIYGVLEQRRIDRFLKTFPGALDIMARGLRAGLSIEKAFDTISREIEGEVGHEFQMIGDEMRIGIPYREALLNSAKRVRIIDYDFFTGALSIQRIVGGSIAEFIDNLSSIIRKREELRLKIKAVSAEAKTTGLIIGILPFITLFGITFLKPEHLYVFQHDPLGRKLMLLAISLIIASGIAVNRLVKIDIQ